MVKESDRQGLNASQKRNENGLGTSPDKKTVDGPIGADDRRLEGLVPKGRPPLGCKSHP